MGSQVNAAAITLATQGVIVTKASGNIAASTTALFTVAGVNIIEMIVGDVTTAMDGTSTNIQLVHNPTVGSVADLCGATSVTSDPLGTLYSYLGDDITTLLVSSGTTAPGTVYTITPQNKLVLAPGVIGMEGSAANVGQVLWYCVYVPLSDGASIVAA